MVYRMETEQHLENGRRFKTNQVGNGVGGFNDLDGHGIPSFARVFLKDPGLVIMDEASSRLDPLTEQLIERAVDRLLENRTGIIIAHRLKTVERADQILILERGQIVEYGDRITLLANPTSRFSALLKTGNSLG
jgi:ABC-type multidrug transport system fused ATPase/permease subunit